MARLKEYYNKEIKKYLKSKLGLENVNEVPKLIKIVVNMGVGESVTDSKKINNASEDLMQITASVGLAQNYGALRSLITSGIQKGHMKMHLINILNSLEASESEKKLAIEYFKNEIVSNSNVQNYLIKLRKSDEV